MSMKFPATCACVFLTFKPTVIYLKTKKAH